VARLHKTLIWERTRQVWRLEAQLREFFPAAVAAYGQLGLGSGDVLALLAKAPDPVSAARLTTAQIDAALKRAGRRHRADKTIAIRAALRSAQLTAPAPVAAAGAAAVRALTALIKTLNEQIAVLDGQVREHFWMHPDAEIIASQPGLGPVLGARVLAEFGDDPGRYASAKARKNYAGTSPITRSSGRSRYVMARYVHNDRLRDALRLQAFAALGQSPGARAYYDDLRARGTGHEAALRQLASRLVGILHGCLKNHTRYDEAIAWPQYQRRAA
jgi:transposase